MSSRLSHTTSRHVKSALMLGVRFRGVLSKGSNVYARSGRVPSIGYIEALTALWQGFASPSGAVSFVRAHPEV